MLQELLKKETAGLHDHLEQLMFVNEIMNRSLNQQQLEKLIITNFLIHDLYESAIHKKLSNETAQNLNIASRNKLQSLLQDFENLNLTTSILKDLKIDKTVEIPSAAFAMGALYVLEGATLGGIVILKQLQQNPNISPSVTFNYYGVYGKELIPKWQEFIKELNTISQKDHETTLMGAKFMFKAIANIAEKVNKINLKQEV